MANLFGIAGNLLGGSLNASRLRAAKTLAPQHVTLEIGTIKSVPLYDADIEVNEGIPQKANALKGQIMAANGLLLVNQARRQP